MGFSVCPELVEEYVWFDKLTTNGEDDEILLVTTLRVVTENWTLLHPMLQEWQDDSVL
jgi:hypothetical protein